MKTMRKRLFLILALVLTLVVGVFATACGDNVKLTLDFGGAAAPIEETLKKGDAYTLPDPTWDGHFFAGWYASSDFSGEAFSGTVTVPDQDTTYYAKWETGYELKLDLDGGTLSKPTSLWLRSGDNILAAISELVPTQEGLTFGAWFIEDKEVTASDRMPASELTVTAKYKVGYTVEYYLQALNSSDNYSLDANRTEQGQDYVGKSITAPSTDITGFEVKDRNVSITLAKRAAENVLEVYYDRMSFPVSFSANAPAGTSYEGNVEGTEVVFEGTITLPQNAFSIRGYRFLGWSTRREGEPEYAPDDTYSVRGNTTFYAIWGAGYTDSFGGDDIIFVEGDEVVLVRGDKEYRGTLEEDGTFTIEVGGREVIRGRLAGSTFTYYREAYEDTFYLYNGYFDIDNPTADPLQTDATLELDGMGGAVYSYSDDDGSHTEIGIYTYDAEEGDYLFVVTQGANAGMGFNFILAQYGQDATPVFAVIGSEAGEFREFIMMTPEGSGMMSSSTMTLDGYGGVTYRTSSGSANGRYTIEGAISTGSVTLYFINAYFTASDGSLILYAFETMPLNSGETAFVLRNENAYGTFHNADGSTLELDGYGSFLDSATLTVGNVETTYNFFVRETSEVFGVIVDLIDANDEVVKTVRLAVDASGQKIFEEFDTDFTEYYWLMLDEDSGSPQLYTPLLVLYDDPYMQDGRPVGFKGEIYAVSGNALVKAASGYYTTTPLGDGSVTFYTFTRTELESGFEDSGVFQTVGFLAGGIFMGSDSLNVYYVFTLNGEEQYAELHEENGNGYIWYYDVGIEGMGALYFTSERGEVHEGSFTQLDFQLYEDELFFEFVYYDPTVGDVGEYITLYFAFNPDTMTYVKLDEAPLALYYRTNDGSMLQSPTLYLDGKGNAIYLVVDMDLGQVLEMAEGTYTYKETTVFGDTVYTFKPAESALLAEEFDFAVYVEYISYMGYEFETPYFFVREDGAFAGRLSAKSGSASLELDGYYLHARYTAANGETFYGSYYFDMSDEGEEGETRALYFLSEDFEHEFIFDVDFAAQTFGVRDGAAGEYVIVDDSYILVSEYADYTILFDGYGNVSLLSGETAIARGAYEAVNEAELIYRVTLEYTQGTKKLEWTVQLVSNGSLFYCALMNEETVGYYVADDLSMLYFDGFGYGQYIDTYGFTYDGYYTYADETHVVFVLYSGNALFVTLDTEENTFEYVDNTSYYATYYAADLGSVIFDDLFYVNGQPIGYYLVNGSTVTLYTQESETEPFEKSTFTLPTSGTLRYDNKDYTLYSSAKQLTLTGTVTVPDLEIEIPNATLTFTPDGSASVEAAATVTLNYQEEAHTLEGFTVTVTYIEVRQMVAAYLVYSETETAYPLTLNCNFGAGTGTFEAEAVMTELIVFDDMLYAMGEIPFDNTLSLGYYGFGELEFSDTVTAGAINSARYEDGQVMTFVTDVFEATGDFNQYYGEVYSVSFTGTDNENYIMDFFIVNADGSPWEGDEDGYLLILYVEQYTDYETDDTANDLVVRVSEYYYSEAFADTFIEGNVSIGLFLKTEDGLTYLQPDEDRSAFAEDGEWAVWAVEQSGYYFYWLIDFTLDEDGNIIDATAEQYIGATLASEDGFGVMVLLSAEEGDTEETYTYKVEFVYGFGLIVNGYYTPLGAIITDNEDGTWTATNAADTWEYTISFEPGEQGVPVCTVTVVTAEETSRVFKDIANVEGLLETEQTLTVSSVGAKETLSGNLADILDTDGKPIKFENVEYLPTEYYDQYGYLYQATIEGQDGNEYQLTFFLLSYPGEEDEYIDVFMLYSFSILKTFTPNGYTVELEQCYYVSPLFEGIDVKGDLYSVAFYRNDNGELTPLRPDDHTFNDNEVIWIIYGDDCIYTYTLTFTMGEDGIATDVTVKLEEEEAETTVYQDSEHSDCTITASTLGDTTTFSGTLTYANGIDGEPITFEGVEASEYEYGDTILYQIDVDADEYTYAITFFLDTDEEGNNIFILNDIEIYAIFDLGDDAYAVVFQFWYAYEDQTHGYEQYDVVGMNYVYGTYVLESYLVSVADDNSYIIFVAEGQEGGYIGVVFSLTCDQNGLVTAIAESGAYYMGSAITDNEQYGFYFLYDFDGSEIHIMYILRVFTDQDGELRNTAATWEETSDNVWKITLEDGTVLTATFSLDDQYYFVVDVKEA